MSSSRLSLLALSLVFLVLGGHGLSTDNGQDQAVLVEQISLEDQDALDNLIQTDIHAAIEFLESQMNAAQTTERRMLICQIVKEKEIDKFESDEEREASPLFQCLRKQKEKKPAAKSPNSRPKPSRSRDETSRSKPPAKSKEEEVAEEDLMIVYTATFYKDAPEDSKACFSYEVPERKVDTGLMTDFADICIEQNDDGYLYLIFQEETEEEEDSSEETAYLQVDNSNTYKATSSDVVVAQLGEDYTSYRVIYNSEWEEFSFSEGEYLGSDDYDIQSSQVVESMFLVNVYDMTVAGEVEVYPIQAKWMESQDYIYLEQIDIERRDSRCMTPEEGRLTDVEMCFAFESGVGVIVSINGLELRIIEVSGTVVQVTYDTTDDVVTIWNEAAGKVYASIISTEILYFAHEGHIPQFTDETLSANLFYKGRDTLEYDCINVYNDASEDFVLFNRINIMCLYCLTTESEDDEDEEDVECGLALYTKSKTSDIFSSFGEIKKRLGLRYETATETIHVTYGPNLQVKFHADEIFYYLLTTKVETLQPLFGDLDSESLVDEIFLSEYTLGDKTWALTELGGYELAISCATDFCYLGIEEDGTFKAAKNIEGSYIAMRTYKFPTDAEEPTEYCIQFETEEGEKVNQCLMPEQIQMYAETLAMFPIYEMTSSSS